MALEVILMKKRKSQAQIIPNDALYDAVEKMNNRAKVAVLRDAMAGIVAQVNMSRPSDHPSDIRRVDLTNLQWLCLALLMEPSIFAMSVMDSPRITEVARRIVVAADAKR